MNFKIFFVFVTFILMAIILATEARPGNQITTGKDEFGKYTFDRLI